MDLEDNSDLEALREFRHKDIAPSSNLLLRIEEDIRVLIEAELEAPLSSNDLPKKERKRFSFAIPQHILRPALAAGITASVLFGVSMFSSPKDNTLSSPVSQAYPQAKLVSNVTNTLLGPNAQAASPVEDSFSAAKRVRSVSAIEPSPLVISQSERDPDYLLNTLRAEAVSQSPGSASSDPTDRKAFKLALSVIMDTQAPADLRSAILRTLDDMNGVDPASYVQDTLGRYGILLSHYDALSGIRDQFVLKPDEGALLEMRSFTTAYLNPACPPGTFTAYDLRDDDGNSYEPYQLPLLDWPQIVSDCSQ